MPLAYSIRNIFQETRELGVSRSIARVAWEFKVRSGALALRGAPQAVGNWNITPGDLPFGDPEAVRASMVGRVAPDRIPDLRAKAMAAVRGRIHCFGRREADFGDPPDWHVQPFSGKHWPLVHWSRVLRQAEMADDVKLTWEIGRFPHAYYLARAAAFEPELAPQLAASLLGQVRDFRAGNPFGKGVHWTSSQEVSIRLWAWLFAASAFAALGCPVPDLARDVFEGAVHVARHMEYAQHAVYNNHLLSEALCLYIAGTLLPDAPEASRWRALGSSILTEQARSQVYPDGGYIQNSHNYHRFAMQVYLLARMFAVQRGSVPGEWLAAMERSLDFLWGHQNPGDGRLPNYGANDGALPLVLTTCDHGDFRSTLQALSLATRNERLYPPGPWDEEAAWLLGSECLEAPLKPAERVSISFSHSGYHVLRGLHAGTLAAFRCGNVLDRFSQIDMLHLDVWWRGHNVLVDPGTYLYNGPEIWHRHFSRTESHNTVQVDGWDQMLPYRKFKCLHWTKARLLRFQDSSDWAICEGEHYGYQRHPGRCIHRRTVLFVKDEFWVVVDRVTGFGNHRIRLHWLGGDFPYRQGLDGQASLELQTPDGPFHVGIFDAAGRRLQGDVIAGRSEPPRGWLSRYYAEKVPVPSLAVEVSERLPLIFVSILGPHIPSFSVSGSLWSVALDDRTVAFDLSLDGTFQFRHLTA